MQRGKVVVKQLLFPDDMIVYVDKGKISTKKLLELISKHRKDIGYTFNIRKLI